MCTWISFASFRRSNITSEKRSPLRAHDSIVITSSASSLRGAELDLAGLEMALQRGRSDATSASPPARARGRPRARPCARRTRRRRAWRPLRRAPSETRRTRSATRSPGRPDAGEQLPRRQSRVRHAHAVAAVHQRAVAVLGRLQLVDVDTPAGSAGGMSWRSEPASSSAAHRRRAPQVAPRGQQHAHGPARGGGEAAGGGRSAWHRPSPLPARRQTRSRVGGCAC